MWAAIESFAEKICSSFDGPEESIKLAQNRFDYQFKKAEKVFKFISWLFYVAGTTFIYEKTKDPFIGLISIYLTFRVTFVVFLYLDCKYNELSVIFLFIKTYTIRLLLTSAFFVFIFYLFFKINHYITDVMLHELQRKS